MRGDLFERGALVADWSVFAELFVAVRRPIIVCAIRVKAPVNCCIVDRPLDGIVFNWIKVDWVKLWNFCFCFWGTKMRAGIFRSIGFNPHEKGRSGGSPGVGRSMSDLKPHKWRHFGRSFAWNLHEPVGLRESFRIYWIRFERLEIEFVWNLIWFDNFLTIFLNVLIGKWFLKNWIRFGKI